MAPSGFRRADMVPRTRGSSDQCRRRESAEWSLTQRVRHRGQIRINGGSLRKLGGGARFRAFAGEHQDRMGANRGRGLEVPQAVAYAGRPVEGDVEALGDGEEHSRIGLAAGRLRLGRVGAIEHRLDAPARQIHRLVHLGVDRVQARHVHEAAADARLIRRDHDAPPGLREARDRLEAPRNRPPFVGMLDELVAVVIDHAIAVEDDEFHAASLEISENRFIALRISVRSARRFSRSFLSSVMTMTASKNESTGLFRDAKAFRYPAKSPESKRGFAEREAACKASKSAISAGAFSADKVASAHDSTLVSGCLTMFAMRVIAAATLAASGSAENARKASRCFRMKGMATGFKLRTASTSLAE